MKIVRNNVWISIAILSLLLGCKKEENPTTTPVDPAKAQQRVNQANQIFVPKLLLIIYSGGNDTSAFNLSAANSLYREALTYNPDNLDAHFGVAMTEEIMLESDPSIRSLFGTTIPAKNHPMGSEIFSEKLELPRKLSSSVTTFLSSIVSSPPPQSLFTVYRGVAKANTAVPFSYYQDIIEAKLLPVLSDAIQHLSRITENPNYAFYITSQNAGITLSDSVRIDLTEIYLLLALSQFIDSYTSFLVAYNVDYDVTNSSSVQYAWTVSAPFLAFRSNGAQRMKDTKSNIVGMATSIQDGITFLLNETPHPGTQLIHYGTNDVPYLQAIVVNMDSVKSLFVGTRTISGDFNNDGIPDQLNVSFANFFDNAISNVKQKLPTYTSNTPVFIDGEYHGVLFWQATTFNGWIFPDPTMNGFFPSMTDAQLKQTFGLMAANWSQGWVVK